MSADSKPVKPLPRRSRAAARLKWLGLVGVVLLALGVGGYWVLTSNAALKALVLPRVSAALNARVNVETIALRPLSEVRLTGLEITPAEGPRLLRAAEVRVRYHLWSLLRGRYVLPEIRLDRPELDLRVTRDGRSNLDALLARPASPGPAATAPPEVDLGTLDLRAGSLSYCVEDPAGGRQCSTVTNLDLHLTGLKNAASARVKLNALFAQVNTHPDGTRDVLRAGLQGESTVGLDRKLEPEQVEADLRATVTEATGALALASNLTATLALSLNPEELRQGRLRFERDGQSLGEARLSGPLQLARREGRIGFQITSIGRAALALLGAPLGLDFGDTTLSGSGFVDLRQRGQRLITTANLEARQFSIKQAGRATPVLDLQFELRGNADLQEQTAYLERLSLSARTAGREWLSLASQRAINLAWSRAEPRAAAPATIHLALRDLSLPEWQAWLPTNLLAGVVNLEATLTSAQDGRQLTLDFTNSVRGLKVAAGAQTIPDLATEATGRLTLREYRQLSLDQLDLDARAGADPLARLRASAALDLVELGGNAQLNVESELPLLLARHPVPELEFSKGRLRVSGLVNWTRTRTAASLTAFLSDLAGRAGAYRLDGYSAEMELSGDLAGDKLTLRRLGLSAREGTRSGGAGELSGVLDAATQTAQLLLNVSGLNQVALRPFLAGLPAGVEIAALTLNATGELRHDARTRPSGPPGRPEAFLAVLQSLAEGRGETSLRVAGTVPTLVLTNRTRNRTGALNGLAVQLDTTRQGHEYTLGTNWLELPATTRVATNRLQFTGALDLAPTNPAPGTFRLRASALDLTPVLDFAAFWEGEKTEPGPGPESEPPPVTLPLRQLSAELQVDTVHLRTLTLRDWTARAELKDGRVRLAPCTLRVEDAPVSATLTLDLTRPGYVYEFGVDAARVHLGPVVDAFAPEYAGRIQGDLFAKVQLNGAGVTGPNLQRHLRGTAALHTTNLNFQVVTPRAKKLLTTLATALRLEALANSPLTLLSARLDIGEGLVNIRPFIAASDAFWATAEGVVRLVPVLTNSPIELPVQLALREDLARQIMLAQLTPSTRTNFLNLPPLVKITGTLGAPETEIDKLRLAALLAGSVGGALGGRAGDALQGVGGLLQGDVQSAVGALGNLLPGAKPLAPTNTPPTTNVPPSTNAPAARTTNAPPTRPGVLDLLEGLRKRN